MNGSPHQFSGRASAVLLVALVVPLHSQQPAGWRDPSSHVTRVIEVGQNVRLEVLDWGGSGRPLVLVSGAGNTAHVFDDFAPKLTRDFHVYGITRRGWGESGFAPLTSGSDTFGDDVLAVLDALKLEKPVLVGHSIGGQELSSVGTRYPNRVAALVYLEATYPYAFNNGKGPTMKEFPALGPRLQPPPPADADLASFDALRQYQARVLGIMFPEAELRQQRSVTAEGRVGTPRVFPGGPALLAGMKQYSVIPVPALVLVRTHGSLGSWADTIADPTIREQARAVTAAMTAFIEQQTKSIEDGVPSARVVRLPGADHYLFLSNEDDVLREMRSFLGRVDDRAAIRAATLDYIEGWYAGNAERMERAVHPELAKRIVRRDPASGASSLGQQSAMTLVQNTRAGGGTRTPQARQLKEVTILGGSSTCSGNSSRSRANEAARAPRHRRRVDLRY
jgi:pimeloyl-ACP methyl ester carboxylesterase